MENGLLNTLTKNWQFKSTIRSGKFSETPAELFDPELKDYPERLLPFIGHPEYERLDEQTKQTVNSISWIAWNKRVVDTEELIVSPALSLLLTGDLELKLSGNYRGAIRQAIVDEYFHSHMHEITVQLTLDNRGIPIEQASKLTRQALLYREYKALAAQYSEQWQTNLILLIWCVVGELSIYEFLTFVSKDESIQPASRSLVSLHERDEAVHASVIEEVLVDNFDQFSREYTDFIEEILPQAVQAFSTVDWLVWEDVLSISGVSKAKEIIRDISTDLAISSSIPLNRSFIRIKRFCEKVGIEYKVFEEAL
ncbi:diiron oxygenase [Catenovulum sp. 2E275]|uniref:diiron oxygenase n=1 Tax=Catenovulum sp. 2E275 TaxID=2980497 RepID=UPI0021D072EB|nr:diiron oxygenase [Catenovulum sp. 2E275]MCU4677553.1 diiron oxygenase [Catenovulum sp. 2E275]